MGAYVGGISRWVVSYASCSRPIGTYIYRENAETVKRIVEDILLNRALRRRMDERPLLHSRLSLTEIKGSFLLPQSVANRLCTPNAEEYRRVIKAASKLPLD